MRHLGDLHDSHLPPCSSRRVRQVEGETVENFCAVAIYLTIGVFPPPERVCSVTCDYKKLMRVKEAKVAAEAAEALRRIGQQGVRGVEDAVSFSVGHRIRIEILAALHEGPATSKELSKIIGQPLSTVSHHIAELIKDASIEIAKTEMVGNLIQHYYCMVKLPLYSDDDVAAMTPEERQGLAAIIIQAATAEAMASLWAGKFREDPRVMLAWNRITLDKQGREDLADEEARSWSRKEEIEAESANRRTKSEEPGVTYIVSAFSFERSRTTAPEPLSSGED